MKDFIEASPAWDLIKPYIEAVKRHKARNGSRLHRRPKGWTRGGSFTLFKTAFGGDKTQEAFATLRILMDLNYGEGHSTSRYPSIAVLILAAPEEMRGLLGLSDKERQALMKMSIEGTTLRHQLACVKFYKTVMRTSKGESDE